MRKMILLSAILALLLSACSGNVSRVKLEIGESALYSPAEIRSAMDMVKNKFRQGFEGCKLLSLRYDEDLSRKDAPEWAMQYDADEAIVLYSNFYCAGFNPTLNSNAMYENWMWILVRSDSGPWQLMTWGY